MQWGITLPLESLLPIVMTLPGIEPPHSLNLLVILWPDGRCLAR